MESTEEILRKQLIEAMEGGKYRILIHRTYTGGDDLSQDGVTKSICQNGLKVFDSNSIDYTTSDYSNSIDLIMSQIKYAYTYKMSDKVFILKVPTSALEYTPGQSTPILYEGNERNLYNSRNNCLILPEYVLGYVNVSKDGISSLNYNTTKKIEKPGKLLFANSVTRQYRWKYTKLLESIRTDKFYTQEEKKHFLHILYSNHGKSNILSKKLMKDIEKLFPDTDIKKMIWSIPGEEGYEYNVDNMVVSRFVDKFIKENPGKKITKRTIEREFRKTRKLTANEICDSVVPSLLDLESKLGRVLTFDEMMDEVSKLFGYTNEAVKRATISPKSIWERFKDIFSSPKKQKLLEAQTEHRQPEEKDTRQELIESLRIEGSYIREKSGANKPLEKMDEERE